MAYVHQTLNLGNSARSVGQQEYFHFVEKSVSNLSEYDRQRFQRFGSGPRVTPGFLCIHHAFESMAVRYPDAIAARHSDESITYSELNRQANYLAAVLSWNGVVVGDNVGLFLQRSIPMLVGILAALKVGAAYVPQHVGVAPKSQLQHIIKSASIRVILTARQFRDGVPSDGGRVRINIDDVMLEARKVRENSLTSFQPGREISPQDCCFVLFTSGTTGKPNGVQVTHGNVCNILLTSPGNLGIAPGDKVAQILSIAFDMAAWEIFVCLSHGGTLLIRGEDIQEVADQANVIIATPSVLGSIDADRCRAVKVAAVAGEPCPRPLADKWSSFCRFYNSCGPTETTIINTAQHYHKHCKGLTIGKPTPNNTVYVLDENRCPCAIGDVGEMWAGGDCVTAGYIDNDELNAERYVDDPFLSDGRKMFRTRDLGRWTEDGELEHFGRTDDQVKIRGFRVELDSVSIALESTPNCERAVTLKLDDRSLVAFVSPMSVDVDNARDRVVAALPYYCVPKFVLPLDVLPKTSRGKIDKRLLLQIAAEHDEQTLHVTPAQVSNIGEALSC